MWPFRDTIKDAILRCGGRIADVREHNTFKVGPYYVYADSIPENCVYDLMKLDAEWMWDNVGDTSIDDMARMVAESVNPKKKKIPKGMIMQRTIDAFGGGDSNKGEQMLFGGDVPVKRPKERKKKQEKGKLKTLDVLFGEEYVPPPKGTKTLRQIFGDEVAPIDRGKYFVEEGEEPIKPTVADEVAERPWNSIWDRSETPDLFDSDVGDYVFERSGEVYQIVEVEREGRVPSMYVYHLKHAYPNDSRVGFERVKIGSELERYFKVLPQDVVDYLGDKLVDFVNGGNKKELWELTMNEFVSLLKEYNSGAYNLSDEQIINIDKTLRDSGLKAYEYAPSLTKDSDFYYIRKRVVEKALKEGKPVRSEVLKDYPDLAKEYGKKEPKEKLIGGYKAGDVEFGTMVKSDWVPPVEEKKEKNEDEDMVYIDLYLEDIPSFNSAKNLGAKPESLTDRQLINRIGKIYLILQAERHNKLPDDYYYGIADPSASGKVPKDMWLLQNLKWYFDEYNKEFEKRGLDKKYSFTVNLYHTKSEEEGEPKKKEDEDMGEWGDKKRAVLEEIKKDVFEENEPEIYLLRKGKIVEKIDDYEDQGEYIVVKEGVDVWGNGIWRKYPKAGGFSVGTEEKVLTEIEPENEPTNEDIVKCAKSLVITKLKEAGVHFSGVEVVGSRSYAETSDMPGRDSDVDVVVYLHPDPNKKGTEVIKDAWNKLGLSIHDIHPWECYGVKIDLIPEILTPMSPIEEEWEKEPELEIPQGKRVDFNGGYAIEMTDINKIYLHFDTIPSDEVRSFLKSRRWWWNRREKVWQKFDSDYAWNSVEDMIDRFYGGTGVSQGESGPLALPTVEEIPVAPSVQPTESSYNPNMGLEIWNYPLRPDQEEAVDRALSVKRGLVVAPTGAGKTIIFIDVLRRLKPHKVVILFPKIALLKQMEERFIRDHKIPPSAIGHYYSNEKDLNKPIVLTTYASAKQNPEMILGDADVVVFDEVHNILGDVAVQRIIGYLRDTDKRVYGFTATPPEGADVLYDFLPLVYESSFSNMREAGNISESMLYMVPLDMSNETKREYEKISEKIDKLKKALVRQLGYLPDFKDMNRMVKSAQVKGETKAIMLALINAYQDRIGILSNDVNKVVGVMEVANYLRRDVGYRGPIMLFTDRVDTLKRLCQELNSTAGIGCEMITGQTKSKDRENILRRWARGDFPILGSINVLAEGIDVPKAKAGIFVGNPGGPTKIVQKAGRLLRKTESGEPARIYMLYLKDTPEIKYVEKMSDKLDVPVDTLDVNV